MEESNREVNKNELLLYHLHINYSKNVKNDSGSLIVKSVNFGEHKINHKKLHPIKFCNFTLYLVFEPFCLNVFNSIKSQRVLILMPCFVKINTFLLCRLDWIKYFSLASTAVTPTKQSNHRPTLSGFLSSDVSMAL